MKEIISVQRCNDYDQQTVCEALNRLLEPLGGMGRFVKPGLKVLLKPNMLSAKPPEAAVTTHPALVRGVAELVLAAGGELWVGDSPGVGSFEKVAQRCGIAPVVRELGGKLTPFVEVTRISRDGQFKQLELASVYLEADLVINLPKLKTHEMMTLTCAVKNLYGAVVGPAKIGLHLTAGDSRERFAGLLLEIALARKVALTIVDGVVAMEGDGPGSGTPRELGLLLASENMVALDLVAARVAGIPSELLPVEQEARRRGLPGAQFDQIELAGGELSSFQATPPFRLPKGLDTQFGLPSFLKKGVKNRLTPYPEADRQLCTLCGICSNACPPKVISIKKSRLEVDSARCIRCWCCRELCPQHAMTIKKGWILKLLEMFYPSSSSPPPGISR